MHSQIAKEGCAYTTWPGVMEEDDGFGDGDKLPEHPPVLYCTRTCIF